MGQGSNLDVSGISSVLLWIGRETAVALAPDESSSAYAPARCYRHALEVLHLYLQTRPDFSWAEWLIFPNSVQPDVGGVCASPHFSLKGRPYHILGNRGLPYKHSESLRGRLIHPFHSVASAVNLVSRGSRFLLHCNICNQQIDPQPDG